MSLATFLYCHNVTDFSKMATASPPGPSVNKEDKDKDKDDKAFECNICLDGAKDAVVSYCGHLFW